MPEKPLQPIWVRDECLAKFVSVTISNYMLLPKEDDTVKRRALTSVGFMCVMGDIEASGNMPKDDLGIYLNKMVQVFYGSWNDMCYYLAQNVVNRDAQMNFQTTARNGKIVGAILRGAIDGRESIRTIAAIIAEESKKNPDLRKELDGMVLEQTNICTNIWPASRDAAHLWAASLFYTFPQQESQRYIPLDQAIPIDDSYGLQPGLEGFLQLADHFYERGTAFRPPKSSKPLIDPETAWRFWMDG